MQPQDDDFKESTLESFWTYEESSSGANLGYSLTDNPGNFTAFVKTQSQKDQVSDITRLVQDTIWNEYLIEVGITEDNLVAVGQEAGLLIVQDDTHFVMLVKSYQVGGTRVRSYVANGGAPTLVDDVAWNDDTDITLQIQNFGGVFKCFYGQQSAKTLTQLPSSISSSGYDSGIGMGYQVGIGAVAGNGAAPSFALLCDYFYFHQMAAVETNGDILIQVTNEIETNGDVDIEVVNYPAPIDFVALQHVDEPYVTLEWQSPFNIAPIFVSPGGIFWTITITADGVISTSQAEETQTPIPFQVVQAPNGALFMIEVDDDGTPTTTPSTMETGAGFLIAKNPSDALYYVNVDNDGAFDIQEASLSGIGVTLVRKQGSYPVSPTDGTVLLSGSGATSFLDGPIPNFQARQYYAIFYQYTEKFSPPALDATMPIMNSLFKNIGRSRFAKTFQGVIWSLLYSISRVLTHLLEVDMPLALAQFNIATASGEFLAEWGQIFGVQRYPGETDAHYQVRIPNQVILPRTVEETIVSQVSAIPGVLYCDLIDASSGAFFIDYSFIDYAGTGDELQEQSDFIVPSFDSSPFFFRVRVRIKQNVNLSQIIQTINQNKAGGVKYVVQVLEVVS